MVELTTRQEAKVITFANKAYQAIGDLADKARLENDRKEAKKIVTSGMKLGIFLIALDDKRTDWSTLFALRTIDRYIDEFDLFKLPFNPAQLSFDNITTRILGSTGDGTGEFATTLQLNAEAAARVNQDNNLQNQINTLDIKVDDLDFSNLVPATAVFSEPTPGYKDFPTELGINLPNKSVLDQATQQDFDDIDLNTTHRTNADVHVTAAQKIDWNSKVTPAELSTGLSGKAALNHTHTIGQIQNLQSELDQLAQSIIANAAEDGVTPSISIGNVVSGTVPSVSLGSTSTTENPVLDFVLVQGEQGEQGDPFQFDAIDFLANRSNYVGEAFGFSFVDVQTGLVYYKQGGPGQNTWSGGIRTIGDRGWTPIHILEPIDGKVYLKLVDYVDGQGVKPTQNIGAYVGPTGYVINPSVATNLKGNKGDSPVLGVDYELPRFRIDLTLTYQQYLDQSATLLSNQAIGYTIYIEDNTLEYENKDGRIVILSLNASTGAREWREYEFQGEQGPAGVPGPQGPAGADGVDSDVLEAPLDGNQYARKDAGWVQVQSGTDLSTATTDDLTEGTTNKYYTEARVSANTDVAANTAKNSYPSADATKLANIEAGAEVNPTIEQTRSQSTTAVPCSKLLDDELKKIDGANSTGTVLLDRIAPRVYGETTPRIGNIPIDLTDSNIGGAAIVFHNDTIKPTIVTDLNIYEYGSYIDNEPNEIYLYRIGSSSIGVCYAKGIFTAGTVDNTAPIIESVTIENGNESRLVTVFSEPVNIVDTTGLSITGDAAISVDSIVSGNGTNTITFAISPDAQAGQSLILNVTSSNTVTDLSSNNNPLAATTQLITNNIGVAQILATPTGFTANNLTSTSIRLNWNSVTDADNYVLERGQQPNYSDAVVIYTGTLLTFDDTGLTENTTYYYRVKAIDNVDNIFGDSNYTTLNIVAEGIESIILNKGVTVYDSSLINLSGANVRDDGINKYLINWLDQSPNANNATQATDENQFRIEEPSKSLIPDAINDFMLSTSVIFFDGTVGFSAYFALNKNNSEDISVIMGRGTVGSYNIFTIKNGSTYEFRINSTTDSLVFPISTEPQDILGNKIFEIHHNGSGSAEILINGVSFGSVAANNVSKNYNRIGSRSSADYLTGKINAIQSYELLDTTERVKVREVLASKFGITL